VEAELHAAFCFDCDKCGSENFVRAIEANLDEASAKAVDDDLISTHFEVVEEEGEPEDADIVYASVIMTRVAIAPKRVSCADCGAVYEVVLSSDTEDE
jgi:hypothetical protein